MNNTETAATTATPSVITPVDLGSFVQNLDSATILELGRIAGITVISVLAIVCLSGSNLSIGDNLFSVTSKDLNLQ